MANRVCALDLGTTSVKAAVFDEQGGLCAQASAPAPSAAGDGILLDAGATAGAALALVRRALAQAGCAPGEVAALAVTNQRASVVPVAADGAPAGPGISWQDTRCGADVARFAEAFGAARFEALTGLPPSFLWTLGKLLHLRREQPEIWGASARFALLHDFVLRAFGADDLSCDLSNASLTGLLDLRALDWSDEILAAAGLTRAQLPALVRSGQRVGAVDREAARASGLLQGTPLVAGGGDQQCAALGQGAVEQGDAGLCLGTAAVVSCPVEAPVTGTGGRFFCTVHAAPGRWVIEGILNSFGSALDWAARVLGLDGVAALEAEAAAASSEGAFFLPHLAGIGSPDHRAAARGAFVGLGLGCTRASLARAAFEGVAHETGRILDAMEARGPIRQLVLSGGGAAGQLLPRLLADLSGRRLALREHHEATLAGAALLAWCGAGRFADPLAAARTLGRQGCARQLEPALAPAERQAARERYLAWVQALLAQADAIGGAP